MANLIVVGAQWGDEGKGKIVDLLTAQFDIVARYQGGHNAGHSVIAGGRKYVLHLIPSGILHPGKICVIGNGVVVDLEALKHEIDTLAAAGISCRDRLFVSDRCHLIFDYHRAVEGADEAEVEEDVLGGVEGGDAGGEGAGDLPEDAVRPVFGGEFELAHAGGDMVSDLDSSASAMRNHLSSGSW